MDKLKVIFMGTPDFAVPSLAALLDKTEVICVVTQPDRPKGRGHKLQPPPVKIFAEENNLRVIQPPKVKARAVVDELAALHPDLIVVVAFGQILSQKILDIPRFGCINVHASLLPRWRGASPIQSSVLEGDSETGVTIQQMGEGLDTGCILSQRSIPIEPSDTGGSLFDKLARLGASLATETVDDILKGRISPVPQDEEKATYAKKIDKAMGRIDWTQSAVSIERQIRALDPWPSAYTYLDGKMLKVWKPVVGDAVGAPCGTVCDVGKETITVACKEGSLIIKEVQIEGKKRMSVRDFLLGYRLSEGAVLS